MKSILLLLVTLVSSLSYLSSQNIYWTCQSCNPSKIMTAKVDGTNRETLVENNLSTPHGIAVDSIEEKIYWSDESNNKIERSGLDGANRETIINVGLTSPRGIELDLNNGKIYWTEISPSNKIRRANLDGTEIEDFITGLSNPNDLVFDFDNSMVYWTNGGALQIQRANLDGTEIETIVSTDSNPIAIALEKESQKIYWSQFSGGKIRRANLDGSSPEDVISSNNPKKWGFTIDQKNNKLYWADTDNSKIQFSDLDGNMITDVTSMESNFVRGITVYEPKVDAEVLDFDGMNDYVLVPDDDRLDPNHLTFEAWLRPTDLSDFPQVINHSNDQMGWYVQLFNNGTVWFDLGNNSTQIAHTTKSLIKTDEWQHLAISYDGGQAKFFINGILEETIPLNAPVTNYTGDLILGRWGQSNIQFYEGQMDEVRIWNIARTEQEILTNYSIEIDCTESNLVAYYQFNQGVAGRDNSSVTTLDDCTTNDFDGLLINFALNGDFSNWLESDGLSINKLATALDFDGVGDHITISDDDRLDPELLTFEVWLRPINLSTFPQVINHSDDQIGWYVQLFNDGTVWFDLGNNLTQIAHTTKSLIQTNQWQHLAISYDGNQAKFFINGVLEETIPLNAPVTNYAGNLILGKWGQSDIQFYEGQMDEVRIWNIARTEQEIQSNYDTEINCNNSNLVAYYQFNQGLAEQDNFNINFLTDCTTNSFDGSLINFALDGSFSNWVEGLEISDVPDLTTECDCNNISPETDSLNLTGILEGDFTNRVITSDGIVQSGDITNLRVDCSITLLPGFIAENGSSFSASIVECLLNATDQVPPLIENRSYKPLLNNRLIIYPNPTSGIVNLSANGEATLNILDYMGRTIKNSNFDTNAEIDLTALQSGIYWFIVQDNSGNITSKKIIKQ